MTSDDRLDIFSRGFVDGSQATRKIVEKRYEDEVAELKAENARFRALIAEIDKHTMFEAYGMGNSFADSIECLVQCGGKCPTVEEAYAGALRCERHK